MTIAKHIFSPKRSVFFRVVIFFVILSAIPFTILLALSNQNILGRAGTTAISNLIFLDKALVLSPGSPIRIGLKTVDANYFFITLFTLDASNFSYLRRKNVSECSPSTSISNVRFCNFTMPVRAGLYEFRLFSRNNAHLTHSQTIKD